MKDNKKAYILFTIISILAFIGLIVSFILTIETIDVLKDNSYQPTCNLNAVLNCSSVMKSKEASFLGFPNPLLGIAGYSMMLAAATAILLGGRMKKLFYILLELGAGGAFIFSYWLISVSVFKLREICPYCVISCFCATNIFFLITIYNLLEGNFPIKKSINNRIKLFIDKGLFIPIIVLWHALIIGIIVLKFLS